TIVLEDTIFEISSMDQEPDRQRLESPCSVESATDLRTPEIPHRLKLVSMIAMQMHDCDFDSLLGGSAGVKRLLEDKRLVPGNGVNTEITDARLRARIWELLQSREVPRHHLRFVEAGKPKTEVEAIRHARCLYF